MVNYYFDIETTGINPQEHQIITIQYQELNWEGKPKKDLIILKEWESSEEDIVTKFRQLPTIEMIGL